MTNEELKKEQEAEAAKQQNVEAAEPMPETEAPEISESAYQQALSALQSASKELPQFNSSYGAQIDDIYQQIMNREKFSYDLDADMLYQQMRDEYVSLGQMAMKDTMGQAAALTGGYGSSYGQGVGQQQYNAYLQSLNQQIPELYSMAYDQYANEGDDLYQKYSLTQNMADEEYGKYQDQLNQYWQNLDYLQGQANTEYAKQQDAYNQLQTLISTTGFKPSAEQLAAAGMTQEQADALRMLWAKADPKMAYRSGLISEEEYYILTGKKKGSGGSGGGGGYSGGSGNSGDVWTRTDVANAISAGYSVDDIKGAIAAGGNSSASKSSLSNYTDGAYIEHLRGQALNKKYGLG